MNKIQTIYDCKPIPMRDLDWLAYGESDDPEDQIYGTGDNLLENPYYEVNK
jgi:hypothetical protein